MPRAPDYIFDLRYASDHFTGIGTHAYGLATALLEAPGDERYRVIVGNVATSSRFPLASLRDHPRVDWIETDVPPMGWRTAAGTGALLRRLGGRVFASPFWLAPDRPGMPVVLTIHDVLPLAVPGTMPWPRRVLYRIAIERAAKVAAVLTSSAFTRGELARLTRIPLASMHTVPLGLMPPAPAPAERPDLAPREPFALVVGINKPHKNLAILAQAWHAMGQDAPLVLVRAGTNDRRYPTLAGLAPRESRVTELGRVDAAMLEWLYRHARLVLFPSRYEGFGLPLLEAAARGTAVLAADIPPLREIGDGVARFLPPGDAKPWAEAVRELAVDDAARARMISAGLLRASDYGYAGCAARTLAILRDVARTPV